MNEKELNDLIETYPPIRTKQRGSKSLNSYMRAKDTLDQMKMIVQRFEGKRLKYADLTE